MKNFLTTPLQLFIISVNWGGNWSLDVNKIENHMLITAFPNHFIYIYIALNWIFSIIIITKLKLIWWPVLSWETHITIASSFPKTTSFMETSLSYMYYCQQTELMLNQNISISAYHMLSRCIVASFRPFQFQIYFGNTWYDITTPWFRLFGPGFE